MLKPAVSKLRPDLSSRLKYIAEKQVPAELKRIVGVTRIVCTRSLITGVVGRSRSAPRASAEAPSVQCGDKRYYCDSDSEWLTRLVAVDT